MIDKDKFTALRKAKGLSQGALGKASGVSQQAIANIETGTSKSNRRLRALAGVLGVEPKDLDPDWDAGQPDAPSRSGPHGSTPHRPISTTVSPMPISTEMPVYAAAQGGDGELVLSNLPVDQVERPPILAHVPGAYGVLVTGTSMVPAYYPGDIALVNPHLPPQSETNCIFLTADRDGEVFSKIKRLLRPNGTVYKVAEFNPPREFELPIAEFPRCHRIVGKYDAR